MKRSAALLVLLIEAGVIAFSARYPGTPMKMPLQSTESESTDYRSYGEAVADPGN